jgi:hypothetical protein
MPSLFYFSFLINSKKMDTCNNIKIYYFAIVLTLNPNKKDVKDKPFVYLQQKIIKWTNNIKDIDTILYSSPFFDIGEKENIHVNLTIKTILNNTEDIRKKYLQSWCLRKGYVTIKQIWDFNGWLEYAKKNHYRISNNENKN